MTTSTLIRGNGTSSNTGFTNPSNAYDNNVATAARLEVNTTGNLRVTMADITTRPETAILSVTAQITSYLEGNDQTYAPMDVYVTDPTGTQHFWFDYTSNGSSVYTQTFPMSKRADGRFWTEADVDALLVGISGGSPGSFTPNYGLQIKEIFATVLTNDAPKVVGLGPNATVNTTRPTWTFTVTDYDVGDTISAYRLRVYNTDKVALATDFNSLDAFGADYDTGTVNGTFALGTFTVPTLVDLVNGASYRAYLDVWDSSGQWSYSTSQILASGYSTVTIDVPQYAIPEIVGINADNTNVKYDVIVRSQDALNFNGGFESGSSGYNTGLSSNLSFSQVASGSAFEGLQVGRLTSSAAGHMIFVGTRYSVNSADNPYISGQILSRPVVSTNNRQAFITAKFYAADNTTVVGTVVGPTVREKNSSTDWSLIPFPYAATPASAAYVEFTLQISSAAAGSEIHELDGWMVANRLYYNQVTSPLMNKLGTSGRAYGWSLYESVAGDPDATATIETAPAGLITDLRAQKLVWTTNTGWKGLSWQHVATVGKTYTHSMWVHTTTATTWRVRVDGFSSTTSGTFAVTANTWTLLQWSGTVSSVTNSSYVTVYFECSSSNVTSFWSLHQVVDTTIPGYNAGSVILPNAYTRGYLVGDLKTMLLQRRQVGTTTWSQPKMFVVGYANSVDLDEVVLSPLGSGGPSLMTRVYIAYDYFAEPNVLWEYQIKMQGVDANTGLNISSGWSKPFQPNALAKLTKPWLKSISNPALNQKAILETTRIERTRAKKRTTHWPLGRDEPVVISGKRKADKWEFGIYCATRVVAKAIEALFDQDETLLIQLPAEQMFINLDGDYQHTSWQKATDEIILRGTFQEVATPS